MFIYLSKAEYATAWVRGGKVPIKLASTYKSAEREGIMTPDENNRTYIKGMTMKEVQNVIGLPNEMSKGGKINMNGCVLNGKCLEELRKEYYDGIVLCLSCQLSKDIMNRLGKEVCVEINNPQELFDNISRQLKTLGRFERVSYTDSDNRDIFIKGIADSWQEEWRMFWELEKDVCVLINQNTGQVVYP